MDPERIASFFEVLYTTRALRRLKPDPVPDDVLFQLIDAAIRAPSGQNAQDWRFIIVTDQALKGDMQASATDAWARYQPRFAANPELMDELPRTKRLSLKSTAYLAHHLGSAPAVIIVCGLKARHSSPGGSIFPSVQNLLLSARALGLGASIFQLALSTSVIEKLGVPDEYQAYCSIPSDIPWIDTARCIGALYARSRSRIGGMSRGRSRNVSRTRDCKTSGQSKTHRWLATSNNQASSLRW